MCKNNTVLTHLVINTYKYLQLFTNTGRNHGLYISSEKDMNTHVEHLYRKAFLHTQSISSNRHPLSVTATKDVIYSLFCV